MRLNATSFIARALIPTLALAGCYSTTNATPPDELVTAETSPPRPTDPSRPFDAVTWTMHYDMRQFDDVWHWLNETVPPGPERSRAIGAAALLGIAELGRDDLAPAGLAAFDEAIPAFPDDARLPDWHAGIRFLIARHEHDTAGMNAALNDIRALFPRFPSFTHATFAIAVGGYSDATPELLEEARGYAEHVGQDGQSGQFDSSPRAVRRGGDSPIAPYNIEAFNALVGDLQLRSGHPDLAKRSYYASLHANNSYRWPWHDEVQRRSDHIEDVAAGLAARPATEYVMSSHGPGDLGVTLQQSDSRFGGRVGNGSCTYCHSHVSNFDLAMSSEVPVGWIRVRLITPSDVPNPIPTLVALSRTDGTAPPGGFSIGVRTPQNASSNFDVGDDVDYSSILVPAPPGSYAVAAQIQGNGHTWKGITGGVFGIPVMVDVRAGMVTDDTANPITLALAAN